MVKIFRKAITGLVLVFAIVNCFWIQSVKAQSDEPVTLQTFYDELEPYGQWIDDPDYGYVWIPDAGPNFKPYATDGHWVATEYGNTWVSDYDWGWAPFHYGRWRFDESYGWEWIPGTEWAPAWVNWRTGDDYYGWAPLGPGIDIDVSFGSGYYEPDNYWIFAPRQYVYNSNISRYYVPYNRNISIIRNTSIINNVYSNNNRRYVFGPRPDDVRRYTNSPVNIYNINSIRQPGGARIRNNTLSIYRPEVAMNRNDNNRPVPNRVISRNNFGDNRNGLNNDNRNRPNDNRNSINNGSQPANRGNNGWQGNNSGNVNGGFGRRNRDDNNSTNGNQLPQRSYPNQNPNVVGNGQPTINPNSNTVDPNNNTVNPNRNRNNQLPVQNQQPETNRRQSSDFNRDRVRPGDNQNPQQNQQRQQEIQQSQQQNQQRQQQMQQRQQEMQQRGQQQQQNQQRQQQNQQRQQETQQRNQENQQRQQQQNQQRPSRQELPQRVPESRG